MGGVNPQPGRHALVEMVQLAAPTVVTMASYTTMQFVDGLMVSRIGPDPVYVAAQGNGGMLVWFVMAFALGALTVVNTYVAQHLGAGRAREGSAYGWNGLWLAAVSAAGMLPLVPLARPIFTAMGHRGDLLALETPYAQILVYGAVFTLAARGIAHYFYGLHRPGVVMGAALTGNVVNVAGNYVLIFGHLGLPALGVSGAAIGTVIGSAIEFLIPMMVFLSPAMSRRYATRRAWRPSAPHLRDIIRIGWPAGAMLGNEMICWAYLMTYLLGEAGARAGDAPEVHNAVGWIALRYMHISFMPALGLSIAVTAMVGRCMGMRRPDLAAQRAWLGLGLTMAYMGTCALAFVLFRRPLIRTFIPESMPAQQVEQMVAIGSAVMIAAAVFQLFDAIAITIIGALRGAGDTVWPGILTIGLSWACIVGGGHAMMWLYPELGSLGPWLAASAYIVLLGVAVLVRFIRGRWRRIDLVARGRRSAAGADQPMAVPADAVAGTTPGTG